MNVYRPTQDCLKFCLMKPRDVPPIHSDIKVIGTFNPAAIFFDDSIALLVRVAIAYKHNTPDKVVYLTYEDSELQFHWLERSATDTADPRVFISNDSKELTLSSLSYLQLFWLRDVHLPCSEWRLEPSVRIMPSAPTEAFGIEDPRCTKIGDRFFITYTSVSRHGASTSLITTSDFRKFDRCGVIFPCENKDLALFPRHSGRKLYALHRPVNRTPFCKPEMWSASSPDGLHWGSHQPLVLDRLGTDLDRVGGGTPPVDINGRYIALYHSSELPCEGQRVGTYFGSTIEFSITDDGVSVVSTSVNPFIYPDQPWEMEGFVSRVVFPTALLVKEQRALIFYGAADENVAVAETETSSLLASLSGNLTSKT